VFSKPVKKIRDDFCLILKKEVIEDSLSSKSLDLRLACRKAAKAWA
jgi:hypothetical protein